MSDIVFLSGKRTPFGTFLGSLSRLNANQLGSIAAKAAVEQAGIEASNLYLKVEAEGLEPEIIRGLGELKPRVIVVDVTPERNGASPRNLIKEILKDKGYSFKDTKRCLFAY